MTDLDPPPHSDPARKKIINLYIFLAVTLVVSVIPTMNAALLSIVFLIVLLIMTYGFRSKQAEGSLGENHATFIIRTVWLGSTFAVFTLIAGCLYMFYTVDSIPLMSCAEHAVNNMGMSMDPNAVMALMQPCIDQFITLNFYDLVISGAIVIAPVLFYFAVRFIRGFSRAIKGYRLADPMAWF